MGLFSELSKTLAAVVYAAVFPAKFSGMFPNSWLLMGMTEAESGFGYFNA